MAIVSCTEQEENSTQVILAVVRYQGSEQTDIEKQIRRAGLVILQQKPLELEEEQVNSWLLPIENDENQSQINYIGYVLQGKDATTAWGNFAERVGKQICGIIQDSDVHLKRFFPSVVTDEYLLKPQTTEKYLSELKPIILDGLKQLCADRPEDPVSHLAEWLELNSTK